MIKIKHLSAIALSIGMTSSMALANAQAASSSDRMSIGGFTSQPIGHYNYCKTERTDCAIRVFDTSPVKLTRKRWAEMVEANTRANSSVRPVTDLDLYGVEELWIMPTSAGDCEDYALMKRKQLMDDGWPASSLLVTVVRQANGDGHAVLTVRTDKADYVLDNLVGEIIPWNNTSYTFLKRQAASNSGKWEEILDGRSMVGSLKK